MTWNPIETAPKDGTIILISSGKYVEAAYWSRHPRATGGDDEFPWVTLDETNVINGRTAESPDHWMPLPDAPTT